MKRLSVIVPGYNTPKAWWVRCVASVDRALTSEDEIVVVDDGSTEKVEREWFDSKIVRIVRHEVNRGLPCGRNSGLEVATGAFVTFVDSDDAVRAQTYEKCLARLSETGADIAAYGVQTVYPADGYAIHDEPEDKFYGALTPADVKYLVRRRLFYYSCNKVFRRSFIDAHQMRFDPEGVPCEDAIFNVGCVVNRAKWVTVGYLGYRYYRYDGSLLSTYKPTLVAGMRKCSAAWKAYKDATPGAYEALGRYDERSEATITQEQWTNIWRRKSPYTFKGRWQWLKEHREILGVGRAGLVCAFVKKALVMVARAHCYIAPIRRWKQKRFVMRIGGKPVKWKAEG